jgi:hypothetical protein
MKCFISVCVLVFLLCGCFESDADVLRRAEEIKKFEAQKTELKEVDYKVLEARGVPGRDRVIDSYIRTVEYDGCEYLIYVDHDSSYHRGVGMTHKGNCRYCKERLENEEDH